MYIYINIYIYSTWKLPKLVKLSHQKLHRVREKEFFFFVFEADMLIE
jgi:hypothetical protein